MLSPINNFIINCDSASLLNKFLFLYQPYTWNVNKTFENYKTWKLYGSGGGSGGGVIFIVGGMGGECSRVTCSTFSV